MQTWVTRSTFIRITVAASAIAMAIMTGAAYGTRLLASDRVLLLTVTMVLGEFLGSHLTKQPGWRATRAGVIALAVAQGIGVGLVVAGASALAVAYDSAAGMTLVSLIMPTLYAATSATLLANFVIVGFPQLMEKARYLTIPISVVCFVVGSRIAGLTPEVSAALGIAGIGFGYYMGYVWEKAADLEPTLKNAFGVAAKFLVDFARFIRWIQARRAHAGQ